TIPIVGVNLTDPIGFGLIASEARPGTNVTGILFRLEGLTGKQMEIALDLVPGASKMGILSDVTNSGTMLQRREVEAAAGKLEVSMAAVDVRTVDRSVPQFRHLYASARASWSFWHLLCSSMRGGGSRPLRWRRGCPLSIISVSTSRMAV